MTHGRIVLLALFVSAGQAFAVSDSTRRGAAITLKVASFQQAQASLLELVSKHHGVAADRHQASTEGGRLNGWTRVVVPKDQLDSFLVDLRELGKSYGEKLSLMDETSLYQDLGKRAERLREHEARLSNILIQRKGLRGSDILFVQERLYRASTDEDTLTEQRDAIPARAAKSSVIVTLFEPSIIKPVPHGIAGHAKASFDEATRGLAFAMLGWIGSLLNLLIFAVVASVGWFLFRRPLRAGFEKLKSALTSSMAIKSTPSKVDQPKES